jgi:hypothetical protein
MSFVLNFREEDAFPNALENFKSICGYKPESEKHQRMHASGLEIRELGIHGIDIKASVSVHNSSVLHEHAVEIDGVRISCDALFSLDKEKVKKVIFYVMTVDGCACESEDLMDRVYADLWGTAYVNAAYELLREEMSSRYVGENEDPLELSDAFGPGYYGMPTSEMKKFFEILNVEEIGVKLYPSGVMVPIKSCAGFLLVMEKGANVPSEHCKHCVGNPKGCQFCVHKM